MSRYAGVIQDLEERAVRQDGHFRYNLHHGTDIDAHFAAGVAAGLRRAIHLLNADEREREELFAMYPELLPYPQPEEES